MKITLIIRLLALFLPFNAAWAINSSGNLTIAVMGKADNNPIFRLTHAGADKAAQDLSDKYHLKVSIRWATPPKEDAQVQADTIQKLILDGVDGIAVSCSDRRRLTEAINAAVDAGIPVACFNSDADTSKRFYYYGTDDHLTGETVMDELAKLMNGKGVIAILSGNPSAPNLQRRAKGVKETAEARYPNIIVRGTFYTEQTAPAASARIAKVMAGNPDIGGWALIGGWSLSQPNAYPWKAGEVKCVAVAALPEQLGYVRNGYVPTIVAQPYYDWGYRTVTALVEKAYLHKSPAVAVERAPISVITAATVEDYASRVEGYLKDPKLAAK